MFHNELVISTFSTHWNCVYGFYDILTLTSDSEDGYAHGALALACSAVNHSFDDMLLSNIYP